MYGLGLMKSRVFENIYYQHAWLSDHSIQLHLEVNLECIPPKSPLQGVLLSDCSVFQICRISPFQSSPKRAQTKGLPKIQSPLILRIKNSPCFPISHWIYTEIYGGQSGVYGIEPRSGLSTTADCTALSPGSLPMEVMRFFPSLGQRIIQIDLLRWAKGIALPNFGASEMRMRPQTGKLRERDKIQGN